MFVILENEIRAAAKRDGITHLSTGIAIERDGKILLVRRVKHDDYGGQYELPGGGIEKTETIEQSVAREALEETGQHVKSIVGKFDGFEYSTPKKPRVRQLNFIVEVGDDDVKLDPAEHDNYQWVAAPEDLDKLTMSDDMRRCVRDVLTRLRLGGAD